VITSGYLCSAILAHALVFNHMPYKLQVLGPSTWSVNIAPRNWQVVITAPRPCT